LNAIEITRDFVMAAQAATRASQILGALRVMLARHRRSNIAVCYQDVAVCVGGRLRGRDEFLNASRGDSVRFTQWPWGDIRGLDLSGPHQHAT
jgi:hypothetical protein